MVVIVITIFIIVIISFWSILILIILHDQQHGRRLATACETKGRQASPAVMLLSSRGCCYYGGC
jgi:hypothetical protein